MSEGCELKQGWAAGLSATMTGEIFGHNGWDPSICKSNRLHVDILRFSFMELVYILSSKIIGNFHVVLNFNWLFLKLNQFICN